MQSIGDTHTAGENAQWRRTPRQVPIHMDPNDPATPLLDVHPAAVKTRPHKVSSRNLQGSFIPNKPKPEAMQKVSDRA